MKTDVYKRQEYTREQINEALESDAPLTLVPSTDTNGHGTFLAGIAAGGVLPEQDFTGAAPECELVIVKLKPAKQYLRDFYLVSSDADAYQENDIMMGIKYLRVEAVSYTHLSRKSLSDVRSQPIPSW